MNVRVQMKNGRVREFTWQYGGNYDMQVSYEPGFVLVRDTRGRITSIPAEDVAEVKTQPVRKR